MLVSRADVRGITLRWFIGLFCALVGAQMLIVPHQFGAQAYDTVRPNIGPWGAAILLAGMAMLGVAAAGGRRAIMVAAHLSAGVVLSMLAVGFALTGGWFGTTIYASLGIGGALAPLLARAPRGERASSDLFAIVMGAALALTGLVILALPDQFVASSFDSMRPYLFWHGLSFVVCGLVVVGVQLSALAGWRLRWLSLLLLVAVVLVPMFARAYVQQIWTGIALYGGSGLILMALPWLGPLLERIDARSFRTRLATTLAISSALALILVVAVDANREESSLRAQASASQQLLAAALGHDIQDYVELHEAAVRAISGMPRLFERSPEELTNWLQAHSASYPSVVVFGLFDADGAQVARSDGRPLVGASSSDWFMRVRESRQPVRFVAHSNSIQRPIFAFAAPVLDTNGVLRGVATATVESSRIADQLREVAPDPSRRAYLVDSRGRTIAHPDTALIATFADLSTRRPVAALLAADERAGSLVYLDSRDEWLAGYARLPTLGWGVVVEQPTSVALASVRSGRERAFGALILVAFLAAAIGAAVAGWLTAPLAVLSLAVRRLADGASDVQLGDSGITEIKRLAGAFDEMRERLTARTREHERSEAALRESDERLRLALQAGKMGTWDWSVLTNALTWDGNLEELHGLTPGSFDGRFETFVEAIHPDDRARVLASIQAALQAGDDLDVEFRVTWPDGSIHWIAGLGRGYLNERGEPLRMAGIGLEVTERQRAEEVHRLLAEAGTRLVSSLDYETTLSGIAQLVATTIADYCIVEVQGEDGVVSTEVAHADASMAARTREVLAGLEPLPSEHGHVNGVLTGPGMGHAHGREVEDAPRIWSDRAVLLPSIDEQAGALDPPGAPGAIPWLLRRDDRLLRLARDLGGRSLICVPLLARERTIGALTLIAAESGRRYRASDLALAEALAARAALAVDNARLYREAQAAIRSRDEFLSIASHELRTPVTGIKGYAQLLLRAHERGRLDGARLTRSLQSIDEASDRLTTLTQDLLDVSRIRLGQLPLRLQEIDLTELVRRVGYRFSDQLPPGVELIVDLRSPLAPIKGDADRLEQVVSNLLENAIKYSPDGGAVRLELGHTDDEIVLEVHDQGIGLPPGAAEAIFHPFGRAPNATQRNLPGMGLGLYICRDIVERHGGRIGAMSPGEGKGTTFRIALPRQFAPDPPAAPGTVAPTARMLTTSPFAPLSVDSTGRP